MMSLHYEVPLLPGEVRFQPCDGAIQLLVGPRKAIEVLASMGVSLLTLALLACLALAALAVGFAQSLGARIIPGGVEGGCKLAGAAGAAVVCLSASLGAAYRRRLGPTAFTITATDFGVNPTDDRFDPIWVPRSRVTFVAARRLSLRPLPGTVCLQIGLDAAPPLVTLSGYPRALVEQVATELTAVMWRD